MINLKNKEDKDLFNNLLIGYPFLIKYSYELMKKQSINLNNNIVVEYWKNGIVEEIVYNDWLSALINSKSKEDYEFNKKQTVFVQLQDSYLLRILTFFKDHNFDLSKKIKIYDKKEINEMYISQYLASKRVSQSLIYIFSLLNKADYLSNDNNFIKYIKAPLEQSMIFEFFQEREEKDEIMNLIDTYDSFLYNFWQNFVEKLDQEYGYDNLLDVENKNINLLINFFYSKTFINKSFNIINDLIEKSDEDVQNHYQQILYKILDHCSKKIVLKNLELV